MQPVVRQLVDEARPVGAALDLGARNVRFAKPAALFGRERSQIYGIIGSDSGERNGRFGPATSAYFASLMRLFGPSRTMRGR